MQKVCVIAIVFALLVAVSVVKAEEKCQQAKPDVYPKDDLVRREPLPEIQYDHVINRPPFKTIMSKAVIQKPAPQFEADAVVNGEFKKIKLSDYKGKYVVLFFYPLDFTFVCPTEIIAFSEAAEQFRKLNVEVIGCSIDSKFTHLAWTKTPRKEGGLGPMNIPLVSDLTHQISRDYGVLIEEEGIALRGLFIIDDKGILRQITINDLPVGRSVDETLRLIQAFQFTDENGEVCPANWKPGKATMVPEPEKSKKYFSKAN
eukprot:Nk52_evm29s271 gene=Nk52_evmTU29s271